MKTFSKKLGYSMQNGIYRHPDRQAVFVGDLIDRGPRNRRVIEVVRAMVENGHGHTVMGNHEYNAICYHTAKSKTDWLRPHTEKNFKQHEAFLREFPVGQDHTLEVIEWFKTLPLFLEFNQFRVIHACWDEAVIKQARQEYLNPDNTLNMKYLTASATENTSIFEIMERLLKGVEVKLPDPCSFQDKDGKIRHHIRVKWWGHDRGSYRDLSFGYGETAESFPADQFPDRSALPCYDQADKPVFFGHYWLTGTPELQQENVCCVDYSAGKEGELVCYSLTDSGNCCQLTIDNFIECC